MTETWFWFYALMGILAPVWVVVIYVVVSTVVDWIRLR